jgi:hypothetical protein
VAGAVEKQGLDRHERGADCGASQQRGQHDGLRGRSPPSRGPSLDQRHSQSYAFRQDQADEDGDGKQNTVLEKCQCEDQRHWNVSRSRLTEDAPSNEFHHVGKDGDDPQAVLPPTTRRRSSS